MHAHSGVGAGWGEKFIKKGAQTWGACPFKGELSLVARGMFDAVTSAVEGAVAEVIIEDAIAFGVDTTRTTIICDKNDKYDENNKNF